MEQHRPPPSPGTTPCLVHGDFRTGNLLVTPDGVTAVLDWEIVHGGDPLEDLGWFCVRAWRFGADDKPAGGFGSRQQLWAGYEAGGGGVVDPEAARWWEIYGTLRWGVICLMQAAAHRLGFSRSVELATIGWRACENEHDVLALLAPDRDPPPPTPVDALADAGAPPAAELVEAVREWVAGDVSDATEGRVRFHARVATNALAMIERSIRLGPTLDAAHDARLARLGVPDDAALAAAIRAGDLDDRWEELHTELWAAARDALAVSHPGLRRQSTVESKPGEPQPYRPPRWRPVVGSYAHPPCGSASWAVPGRPARPWRRGWRRSGFDVIIGSRSKYRAMETVDQLLERWPDRRLEIGAGDNAGAAEGDLVVIATPWDGADADSGLRRCGSSGARSSSAWRTPSRGSARSSSRSSRPAARSRRRSRRPCRTAWWRPRFHHVPAKELGDLDHPIESDVLVCSDHPAATRRPRRSSPRSRTCARSTPGSSRLATPIESFTAVLLQLNVRYKTRVAVKFTGIPEAVAPELVE